MAQPKSVKLYGVTITFQKLWKSDLSGTYVNAFYKSVLVGTGRNKTEAKKSIKKKLIDRLR